MTHSFHRCAYTLTRIADTSGRFSDFSPYVASVNDAGVVAFQAALRGGGTGVYAGAGGAVRTLVDSVSGALAEVSSHPDINREGASCFYGQDRTRQRCVFLLRDGQLTRVADMHGPAGPTMNEEGMVAFRTDWESGVSAICTGRGGDIVTIADTVGEFAEFHGLPVINNLGAVVFRADRKAGGQGIYVGDANSASATGGRRYAAIVETGQRFRSLGYFPINNDAGTVAFAAALESGGLGIFAASDGGSESVIDSSGSFESFRGVLIDNAGRVVFYATPRDGTLGVFTGPDAVKDRLICMGAPLFGSTVADFALNPVSINDAGQIAIRVKLADGRQFIVRANPVEA